MTEYSIILFLTRSFLIIVISLLATVDSPWMLKRFFRIEFCILSDCDFKLTLISVAISSQARPTPMAWSSARLFCFVFLSYLTCIYSISYKGNRLDKTHSKWLTISNWSFFCICSLALAFYIFLSSLLTLSNSLLLFATCISNLGYKCTIILFCECCRYPWNSLTQPPFVSTIDYLIKLKLCHTSF
jgi:hypothetical protein